MKPAIPIPTSPDFAHLVELVKAGNEGDARRELRALSPLEYERIRDSLAKESGMRASALDALRKPEGGDQAAMQGKALELESPKPADEPQCLAELLDDVEAQVKRFLVADDSSILAIALWCAWAYLIEHAQVAPILCFASPTRACGKSRGLEIVSLLTPKAMPVSGISPAAVFRVVEQWLPTLLIDEADTIFRNNDELRTLLNGGFTRIAARVARIVGDDMTPRLFSTWSAKACALIGTLPDTLASRSIIIPMRRKRADEKCESLRADRDQGFGPLRARLARWAQDEGADVIEREPEVPGSLSDRQADAWRELLRIADAAGSRWPDRARGAAIAVCTRDSDEDGDAGVRMLRDLRGIFESIPERKYWPSQTLVDALNATESAPWAAYNKGHGLKPQGLAKLCKRFSLEPKPFRQGTGTVRGYHVSEFLDAFARYLADTLPSGRNSVTPSDNSLPDKEKDGYGDVTVSDAKRNTPDAPAGRYTSEAKQKQEAKHDNSNQIKELSKNVSLFRLEDGNGKEEDADEAHLGEVFAGIEEAGV